MNRGHDRGRMTRWTVAWWIGLLLASPCVASAQHPGAHGPFAAAAAPIADPQSLAGDTMRVPAAGNGKEDAMPEGAVLENAVPDARSLPAAERRFALAGGQVFTLNFAMWALNYSVRGHSTFRISPETMWRNFGRAQWDVNRFGMNQFGHPYNGGLYYNAGRSNGYGLIPSAALAVIGSYMWECCFEAEPPSINDLVNTSLGGVSFGETTHRLAALTYQPGVGGLEGFGRGVLGFILDPMGGLTRIVTGRPAAAGRAYYGAGTVPLRAVLRAGGMNSALTADRTPSLEREGPILDLDLMYGDPFQRSSAGPYDYFNAIVQIDFTSRTPMRRLSIDGVLAARRVGSGAKARHVLGLNQRFELMRNDAFEYGGPSLTGGLTSAFPVLGNLELRTFLGLDGVILGAVESDHIVSRSHDYGPGAGAIVDLRLRWRGTDVLQAGYSARWIHVLDGTATSHRVQVLGARATAPLFGPLGAGFDYTLYLRDSRFAEFADVHRAQSEIRAFATYFAG